VLPHSTHTLGGAQFSEKSAFELVNGLVSHDEIAQWQHLNDPDGTDHNTRNALERARNSIRLEHRRDFVATAAPEKNTTGKRKILSVKPGNIMTARPTKQLTQSQESAPPIRPKPTLGHMMELGPSQGVETSNIDPRLLDENCDENDLDSIEVDQVELNILNSQVLLAKTPAEDPTDEDDSDGSLIALQELIDGDDSVEQRQSRNKYDFITHYSKVNVVDCTRFAVQWANHKE
jgi:hypothetical protein